MNVFVKKQKKRKGGEKKKKITRVDGQGEKKEAGETHRVVEVFAGGFCRSRRARARCGGGTPGADAGRTRGSRRWPGLGASEGRRTRSGAVPDQDRSFGEIGNDE